MCTLFQFFLLDVVIISGELITGGEVGVWIDTRRQDDPGALKVLQEQKGSHFNCSFKYIAAWLKIN